MKSNFATVGLSLHRGAIRINSKISRNNEISERRAGLGGSKDVASLEGATLMT